MQRADWLGFESECEVQNVWWLGNRVRVEAHRVTPCAACPLCGTASSRIHSHYSRRLRDLPCGPHHVELVLQCRKFFCDQPQCHRRIFTESLLGIAERWARCTQRMQAVLMYLGLVVGGETGQRVARELRLSTSADTLLRRARRWSPPSEGTPRLIGIDDWAWRKGCRYGTMVVDLERRCPLALLPDREVETVAAWLKEYPSLELIARDRASGYAQAAREAAPQAVQVADRWHLLANLGTALERILLPYGQQIRTLALQRAHTTAVAERQRIVSASQRERLAVLESSGSTDCLRRTQRLTLYEQIHQLHSQGVGIRAMGRQMKLSRNTVRRHLASPTFPERASPRRVRGVDAFVPYLQERWLQGEHNATRLWKELQERGYRGSVDCVQMSHGG